MYDIDVTSQDFIINSKSDMNNNRETYTCICSDISDDELVKTCEQIEMVGNSPSVSTSVTDRFGKPVTDLEVRDKSRQEAMSDS